MTVFLFFDESGDLNFSDSGSPYYFFGALTTRAPGPLTHRLSELRYQFLAEGLELERFHAADRLTARRRSTRCLHSIPSAGA